VFGFSLGFGLGSKLWILIIYFFCVWIKLRIWIRLKALDFNYFFFVFGLSLGFGLGSKLRLKIRLNILIFIFFVFGFSLGFGLGSKLRLKIRLNILIFFFFCVWI
jgi:hypothetical protein